MTDKQSRRSLARSGLRSVRSSSSLVTNQRVPTRSRAACRRTGDHRYEVGYADVDGAWRMKTLKARSRTEARAERDEFLATLRRGEVVVPSRVTVRDVIDEYLAGQDALVASGERAERTVERYRQHLEGHVAPRLGHVPVQKVTPERLARFFHDKRASGLAPWTLRGMLTPLRRTLALAVRRRYIAKILFTSLRLRSCLERGSPGGRPAAVSLI